jgi:hypothetical protein
MEFHAFVQVGLDFNPAGHSFFIAGMTPVSRTFQRFQMRLMSRRLMTKHNSPFHMGATLAV